ncbi:hypothetical protein CCACVL1_06629 [Corchorus capsularis]|uniref:Uncharacterized protein n=1 Tax=Corchorus capsularis TaxID=210143 RepID=A0A1R3JE52_COCAP|nr:hypothetical protein CCACVL1_06629 [Corchorus capsularis]
MASRSHPQPQVTPDMDKTDVTSTKLDETGNTIFIPDDSRKPNPSKKDDQPSSPKPVDQHCINKSKTLMLHG